MLVGCNGTMAWLLLHGYLLSVDHLVVEFFFKFGVKFIFVTKIECKEVKHLNVSILYNDAKLCIK
jgi:hypothetical protein